MAFAHETERRLSATRAAGAPSAQDIVWRLKRSPPNPRDKTLSKIAIAWLDGLPASLRPIALSEQYPRIANRLAICWGDPKLTALVLQELLADRRGNRRGYPAEVHRELVALQHGCTR